MHIPDPPELEQSKKQCPVCGESFTYEDPEPGWHWRRSGDMAFLICPNDHVVTLWVVGSTNTPPKVTEDTRRQEGYARE